MKHGHFILFLTFPRLTLVSGGSTAVYLFSICFLELKSGWLFRRGGEMAGNLTQKHGEDILD